jgi:hypothetical protein
MGGREHIAHTAAWGEPAGRAALETAEWILALEQIARRSRVVWHIEAIDELDGAAQRLLARRLGLGFWTADALGRVPIAGTIVIISVAGHLETRRPAGFHVEASSPDEGAPPVARVVADLRAECDTVIAPEGRPGPPPKRFGRIPGH